VSTRTTRLGKVSLHAPDQALQNLAHFAGPKFDRAIEVARRFAEPWSGRSDGHSSQFLLGILVRSTSAAPSGRRVRHAEAELDEGARPGGPEGPGRGLVPVDRQPHRLRLEEGGRVERRQGIALTDQGSLPTLCAETQHLRIRRRSPPGRVARPAASARGRKASRRTATRHLGVGRGAASTEGRCVGLWGSCVCGRCESHADIGARR